MMLATPDRRTPRARLRDLMKSAGAGVAALMSSRILSITDVMVCVVNTLAVTTCPGGRRRVRGGSASSRSDAYHPGAMVA